MTESLGELVVKFDADLSGLNRGTAEAQNTVADFGKKVAGIAATGLLVAGAAAVAFGVSSVKAAADFQSGMTTLVTGAGEAQKNIKMVSDGILNMAVSTGTSTQQLTAGMYMIESAGFHGADALKVLQAAAQGAKVGNADLGTVANATTTIMKDFASQGVTASQAVNTLVATVANGKTTMQDLSASLSQVLPTASAAGVGLNGVMAAMATMTGEGVPAADAATYLRQTLMSLDNPSTKAVAALKSVGLSSDQVAAALHKSLPDAIQMIADAVGKKFPEGSSAWMKAMADISGGTKTMQGMLDLTGSHLKDFQANMAGIAGAVKKGGDSITGWSLVQQDFNFQLDKAREAFEVLQIKVGSALLPVLGKLMAQVTPLITQFGDWLIQSGALQNTINILAGAIGGLANVVSAVVGFFERNQAALTALKIVGIAVAGAIAATMVVAFYSWAVAAGAAAIATLAATWPILAIGAVIALVVVGIIAAIQHWGAIGGWLAGVWQGIATFFVNLWNGIETFFQGVWNFLVNAAKIGLAVMLVTVTGPTGLLALFIISHWQQVKDWFTNFWASLKQLFQDGMAIIAGIIQGMTDTLYNLFIAPFVHAWQTIEQIFNSIGTGVNDLLSGNFGGAVQAIGGIPGFANGVQNFSGGLAVVGERGPELVSLPRGASVTPMIGAGSSSAGSRAAAGGTGTTTVVLQLDSVTIAQVVAPHLDQMVRAKFGPRSRTA